MPIVVPVRFRYATIDLWFDPVSIPVHRGDHVIVTTERGIEIGLAVDEAFNVNEETLRAPLKEVLRVATEEDIAHANELSEKAQEAFTVFKQTAEAHELEMKPVACEYLFGGEKIVCYFAADDRVDFRELVKDLSSIYKMRVDMRQIGVRDQARLVGGFGHCGQELCCKRFGREFDPVSIRMAKAQDLALNPSKISGACGRLMCCLRYEFEAYKDFKSRAPKDGGLIDTPLGTAKVVGFDTPRENILLRLEDGKNFTVPLKKMCCKKSGEGSCCSGCTSDANTEQKDMPRPDAVTLEQLATIDDQGLKLLLSQLETQRAMEEMDAQQSHRSEASSGTSECKSRSDRRVRKKADTSEGARQSAGDDKIAPSRSTRVRRRVRSDAHEGGSQQGGSTSKEAVTTPSRGAATSGRKPAGRTVRARTKASDLATQHADRPAESVVQPGTQQQTTRRVRRRTSSQTSSQHAQSQHKVEGQERKVRRRRRPGDQGGA